MKMLLFSTILTYCFFQCVHAQDYGLLSRMMYGKLADITDFPYFAALEHCTAVIISDTWLLTAAHCVTEDSLYEDNDKDAFYENDEELKVPEPEDDKYEYYEDEEVVEAEMETEIKSENSSPFDNDEGDYVYPTMDNQLGSVWVGGNNINTGQKYGYDTVVVHPDYKYGKDGKGIDDIALLKLTKPLNFSEVVQAVALPEYYDEDYMLDAVLTVAGVDRNQYHTRYNNFLLKMDVSILTLHDCLSHFTVAERIMLYPHRHEFEGLICTKRVTPYVSNLPGLCYGDSGSPLVFNNTLVGLGISADDVCQKIPVSMFMKVARYTEWIRFITGISKNPSDTDTKYYNSDRSMYDYWTTDRYY